MFESLMEKNVEIALKNYNGNPMVSRAYKGRVTECNELFITLDHDFMIAVKYIETIRIFG